MANFDQRADADGVSRRSFCRSAGRVALAASAAVASPARAAAAPSNQVRVGIIGYGLIGKRHVVDLLPQRDARIVAVAEAHAGRLEEARAYIGGAVRGYRDFRRLLDDPDIDAVVISTPDHWHALMTMLACAAGKDVYVEKPLTLFPREGEWMLRVAERTGRVVQVGTQQRSGPHYAAARELVRSGQLGQVTAVRFSATRNVMPGFGRAPDGEAPPEVDWNLMLGPAPWRAYNPRRAIYHFRWFWDYSGGQMTNLGAHSLDIVDWYLGGQWPTAISSVGGRLALTDDDGETPDTQEAVFQFPGWTASWSLREACQGSGGPGLEFFGTHGSLSVSRGGYRLFGDRRLPPNSFIPQFTGAHPVGGPVAEPVSGPPRYWVESREDNSGDSRQQLAAHVRNFLDCIKSRETPVSDLASGHRVATICQLANISLRLGRGLKWDGARQQIVGDREAAEQLERPYRAPWDAELRALL